MLAALFYYHNWTRTDSDERGVIKWDVISYYSYLPATFIYGDVKLGFVDVADFVNDNKFWFNTLGNGNRLIQTSMGLSFLYTPFFFTAHLLAPVFGEARDGFSAIYQFFLAMSALFYVIIGLIFLRRILLKYFSPVTTAVTLIMIGLGTNLFFYTAHEGTMSHSYSFALITIFLYLVIRWYETPRTKTALWIGLLYGLIVLVRPSNIIAGTLLLFWGVDGWKSLQHRARFLAKRYPQLILMVLMFLIPWIPQLIYWKAITGSFLFNSYGPSGSTFYFGSPHIFQLLFSFRKGWYIYTPVMLVATVGIWFLGRQCKAGVWPVSLYLVLQIYLLASWWSWWTGGSFGLRSFIDLYGIMALPLAAVVERVRKARRVIAISFAAFLMFLLFLNQFQTFQYTRGYIHHTGMTGRAYRYNFLKFKPGEKVLLMFSIPDPELARLGIYYDYYTGDNYDDLRAMERGDALEQITGEIEGDRRLRKEIRNHAGRTGIEYEDALNMVAERIYEEKISGNFR